MTEIIEILPDCKLKAPNSTTLTTEQLRHALKQFESQIMLYTNKDINTISHKDLVNLYDSVIETYSTWGYDIIQKS